MSYPATSAVALFVLNALGASSVTEEGTTVPAVPVNTPVVDSPSESRVTW